MLKKFFSKLDLYLLGNSPILILHLIYDRIAYCFFYSIYYQLRFKKYGKNIRWGRDFRFKVIPTSIRISCPEKIQIEDGVQIDQGVYLQCGLNSDGIQIGRSSRLNKDVHILAGDKIIIEENVLIAPRVLICSNNHAFAEDLPVMLQGMKASGEIIIHSGVWIGQSAIILGGCQIGKNSVVGANVKISKKIIGNKQVVNG